jgi:sugar lactone lactonase YvrE
MSAPRSTTPLLSGLRFPEGPRWRGDRLWFSDQYGKQVVAVDLAGRAESVVDVPGQPSGLGWLPDGRLLIVSMCDRKLLCHEGGQLREVADLSAIATFHANDMVVDGAGRAYVGNFGFDLHGGGRYCTTSLALVHPDGRVRVAADDLAFPNGSVITPDGGTLIVAETFGARLTAFDVDSEGALSNRRLWAKLEGAVPDGICLDAEGAIWVASPVSAEVLRVREGGEVSQRIRVATQAFACMLGGPERRTLFICTASDSDPAKAAERSGRIEYVEVEVPGAGLP